MKNAIRLAIVVAALNILSAPAFGAARVSDIVGSTENAADDKFYERGFELVDGKQSGDSSFKSYYNSDTNQCVMAEILDNRVISVNPSENAKCGHKGANGHGNNNHQSSGPLPREITGLVGNKRQDAEDKLVRDGYTKVEGNKSHHGTQGLWWNRSSGECLSVEAQDGRVRSIDRESRSSCN